MKSIWHSLSGAWNRSARQRERARQRRRTTALGRIEELDQRIVPAIYILPVTADGTVFDHDRDGTFDGADTSSADVTTQLSFDPAIGDTRAAYEFTIATIPSSEIVTSVVLRLNFSTVTVPADVDYEELNFFGQAGDGIIDTNDVSPNATSIRDFVVPITFEVPSDRDDAYYDISLSPSFLQSQLGSANFLSIVSQMQTVSGVLAAASKASGAFSAQLIVTTNTSAASTPTISMSVSPVSIAEDAGPNAAILTVNRANTDLTLPLSVSIASSDPTEAIAPLLVTFPPNVSSIQVHITAVDDALLDGPQVVRFVGAAQFGLNGSATAFADPLFGGENGIMLAGGEGSDDDGSDPDDDADEPYPKVAVQDDGKVVTFSTDSGFIRDFGASQWRVTRINPDGTYDKTFGNNGIITDTLPNTYFTIPSGLVIQPDGKVVIAASSESAIDGLYDWFMVRYNVDGTRDSTFGSNGVLRDFTGSDIAAGTRDLALLADGSLILGGILTPGTGSTYAVAKYLPNGTRDTTFGNGGVAYADFSPGQLEAVHGMAIQPDGKIVLVGSGTSTSQVGIVRFNADGTLDSTFGSGGFAGISLGTSNDVGEAVVIQPDGKILVAARTSNFGVGLGLLRLTTSGQLDTTFSSDGFDLLSLNTQSFLSQVYSMVLQPDGRIIIGGGADAITGTGKLTPTLVRYLPTGDRDSTFGPNGIYQVGPANGFPSDDGASFYSLAAAKNGQLVALAASHSGAYVVRFGSGGTGGTAVSNDLTVTDRETLSVTLSRDSISETAGPFAAFGIVTRNNTDIDHPLVVSLQSSDTTESKVPAIVTIPAGQASVAFVVQAIDDALFDGNQTVTITASATGYVSGSRSLIVTDNEAAGAIFAGDILVTRPSAVAGAYEIAEFTPAGNFVHAITVPWGGAGSRPASEVVRDLVQDQAGKVYLYNGTQFPYLTSYNPATAGFSSQNFSGLSSDTASGTGGIATFHQFVFITDSNTPSATPAGIVRLDRTDGSLTRFSNATGYQDLTIGLNGLLYALNQNQHIDVYDPVTMQLQSSVNLPAGDYRGIAVRTDGEILAAGANGTLYLFDTNGTQLNAVVSGAAFLTDIDLEPGGRVIAGTLGGEVVVTDSNLSAPTKFTASTTEAFVAFAIDANFPVPTVHTTQSARVVLENDPATIVDPGLLVSDDGTDFVSATVTFTAGYQQGLDILGFADQNGIKGTFDEATGTLKLTGTSSLANYQAALRSVTYHTTSNTPALSRTVTFTVSDGVNAGSATRVIQVTPQNDPPTIFPNQFFFVPENSANGTNVGIVLAFDDDSPVLSGYTIVSGNASGIFTINPANGQIKVADGTQLDFETRRSYVLGITVSDGSLTSAVQNVSILVTDENDNPPIIRINQVFDVFENAPNGTNIGELEVADIDTVGFLQDYTIVFGNTNGAFSLGPDEEDILVLDGTKLDYETQKVYILGVQVSDGVHLSAVETIQINVKDVNDVPPVVLPATLTVPENSPANTSVGSVPATDIDTVGTLQDYAIVSGNASGAFQIDAVSGLITVKNSAPLNFETTPVFSLGVVVSDGLHVSAPQTITINLTNVNESPNLSPKTFSIPELSVGGTVIGTIQATDPDAGQTLTYGITSGNAAQALTLDPHTGVLTVQNGAVLDFETTPVYTFTVTATDNGNPTLLTSALMTVNLTDVNDVPTIRAGQSFTIPENSANNSTVGTVEAHDADAGQTLTYSITGGNASGAFAIDPVTGVIRVADGSKLDFETTPSFTLTITVTDNGVPQQSASAPVQILVTNVNDAPTINSATFTVPENSAKNTVVGTVIASDQDAGQQKLFSIISGNTGNAFSIHLSLGTLTVNNPAALDFETNPTFTLQVRVQDNGSPSLSAVGTITVNLSNVADAPVFNDQSFSVSELATAGAAVGTLVATNPDQQTPLNWQIISGDPNGTFALDQLTGVLTVANAAGLDFETQPSIPLQVQVSQTAAPFLSTTATVTVTVTDANEAPVLGNATFSVNENSVGGTLIGTLAATDQDAGQSLSYSITGGNTGSTFSINPTTGALTVSNGAVLDFETNPDYNLTVTVTDNGAPVRTTNAAITVHLTDVNEAPLLADQTISIPENTAEGTVLTTLVAQNPEPAQQLTYSIIGGNANGSFAVDPTTGQLTVVDNAVLDFEVLTQIVLTVKVVDNGQPAQSDTATVTINLTDVNDAPHFVPATFTLEENSPVGTVVGTIAAVDQDAGQHVSYAVTDSDLDGLFAVSQSGVITIAAPNLLDFETHPIIHFTITASDDGHPPASESHEFTLQLTNVDEAPEIVLAPGTRILTKPYAKQVVDSHAFIRDVDTPVVDVANSTVEVKVVQNAASGDKARLLKSKGGDVTFKGKNVLYQGTVIGERIYGKKGAVPLTIHFNGAATQAAVEGVLQKITFKLKGASGATRTLEFSLIALNNGQSSHTQKVVQRG